MTDRDSPRREQDRRLVDSARAAMARRDQALDGETLSRLRRARADAVAAQGHGRRLWLPAGGAVAVAVLVAALLWSPQPQPEDELFAASAWLLDDEMEIEVIEDIEFYQWLADEELVGEASGDHSS